MKCLVTGSNGFLGPRLVERLLQPSSPQLNDASVVRALVRAGGEMNRLGAVVSKASAGKVRAEVVTGSLASPEAAAAAVADADVVYHLAAALKGAPADMFLGTVVTTKNLLEGIRRLDRPVKLVLVSSFSVYGVSDLPRGHVLTETTPLEPHPERRDIYAQAKLRQEQLCWEHHHKHGLPLVVLRPGVIYGPGGSSFSNRVGLRLPGLFLSLGGDNQLPLSFVDNCADAIAIAGASPTAVGQAYNVHDDDLPTCRAYLRLYQREVEALRVLRVPFAALRVGSRALTWYNRKSQGQLPAVFTPYKSAATWKGCRFDNAKLKSLGWRPAISTDEGLRRTMADLKCRLGEEKAA